MKRYLAICAVALSLGGCAGTPAGDAIGLATKQFANPVAPVNMYQVKLAYAGSQELVLKYQRDCFGSDLPPYPVTVVRIKADPVLSVQCSHRVSRYNGMKKAEGVAFNAVARADDFIARNPSGNAISYISAAWKAVSDYRAAAAR